MTCTAGICGRVRVWRNVLIVNMYSLRIRCDWDTWTHFLVATPLGKNWIVIVRRVSGRDTSFLSFFRAFLCDNLNCNVNEPPSAPPEESLGLYCTQQAGLFDLLQRQACQSASGISVRSDESKLRQGSRFVLFCPLGLFLC
jgi:hypothetical protein